MVITGEFTNRSVGIQHITRPIVDPASSKFSRGIMHNIDKFLGALGSVSMLLQDDCYQQRIILLFHAR